LKGVWDWSQGNRELFGSRFNLSAEAKGRIDRLASDFTVPTNKPRQIALEFWDDFISDFDRIRQDFASVEEIHAGQLDEAIQWMKDQYGKRQDWADDRKRKTGSDEKPVGEDRPTMDVEDDPILLFLYHFLAGELPGPKTAALKYSHVFVDEAQDYAAIELKCMLNVADSPYSITFAGDVNQQMIRYNAFKDWDYLFNLLGLQGQQISSLKVSYRSTFEIMDFALKVLGDLTDERQFLATRHGPAVELFQFPHQGEQMKFLALALKELMLKEGNSSCALITKDAKAAKELFANLDPMEIPRLRLVEDEDFTFTPGIDITEIRQVKGLEFDYVALMDVDTIHYPDNSYDRFLLHIGGTRAAHQVWVLNYRLKSTLLPKDIIEIKT